MAVQRRIRSAFDPYKNFKFRVKWDSKYVAGVSKVSALKRTTEVVKHREGGDPSSSRKSPGKTEYEAITLERGVTHDIDFEQWANKVWNYGAGLGSRSRSRTSARTSSLELYNEAGQLAIAYHVYRCWVSEFQALPELDANANAVAIQTLKLENEGWSARHQRHRADGAELHRTGLVSLTRWRPPARRRWPRADARWPPPADGAARAPEAEERRGLLDRSADALPAERVDRAARPRTRGGRRRELGDA